MQPRARASLVSAFYLKRTLGRYLNRPAVGPLEVNFWTATELKNFRQTMFEFGSFAALGGRWESQLRTINHKITLLNSLCFFWGFDSLRNAGVTGSSPVGGTSPWRGHLNLSTNWCAGPKLRPASTHRL